MAGDITTNCVLAMAFENNWDDLSGNHTPVNVGAVFAQPGIIGSYKASYDGIDDRQRLAAGSMNFANGSFTASMWLAVINTGITQYAFNISENSRQNIIDMVYTRHSAGNYEPRCSVRNGGALIIDVIDLTTNLADGSNHHVVHMYDHVNDLFTQIVNGVVKAKSSLSVNLPDTSTGGHVPTLGFRGDNGSRDYKGFIDSASIYSRALSYGGVAVGQTVASGSDVGCLWNAGNGNQPFVDSCVVVTAVIPPHIFQRVR